MKIRDGEFDVAERRIRSSTRTRARRRILPHAHAHADANTLAHQMDEIPIQIFLLEIRTSLHLLGLN